MASDSKIVEIFEKLDEWLERSFQTESGEKARKWFEYQELQEMIEEEIKVLDELALTGYQQSGTENYEETPSPDFLSARRNELSFAIGLLSGIRKRYVSGEDSKPLRELDTNRYNMYSLQSRRAMINKFRAYSESVEE